MLRGSEVVFRLTEGRELSCVGGGDVCSGVQLLLCMRCCKDVLRRCLGPRRRKGQTINKSIYPQILN